MRAGRERTRDGLAIDVALIVERDSTVAQRLTEVDNASSRTNPHFTTRSIDRDDPLHRCEIEDDTVGRNERRVAVARAQGSHAASARGRSLNRSRHCGFTTASRNLDGRSLEFSRPVRPVRQLPSPLWRLAWFRERETSPLGLVFWTFFDAQLESANPRIRESVNP